MTFSLDSKIGTRNDGTQIRFRRLVFEARDPLGSMMIKFGGARSAAFGG
jgi:hypothetical protein